MPRLYWTPENTRQLIELAATKTIPEIARIMGASKNSVVGRAHRLGISFPQYRAKCAGDHMEITNMLSAGMKPPEIAQVMGQHINTIHGKIRYMRRRAGPTKIPLTLADLGPDQCLYPLGGPKEPAHEFCGKPAIQGKPYCKIHTARCYLKPTKDKGQPFHFERKRGSKD